MLQNVCLWILGNDSKAKAVFDLSVVVTAWSGQPGHLQVSLSSPTSESLKEMTTLK